MPKQDELIEQILNDSRFDIREDGTVWRYMKTRKAWKQIGTYTNGLGYYTFSYRDSKIRVHRIVYARWVGGLKKGFVVDHIDGDSTNNAAGNLQQISQCQNVRKGQTTKLTRHQVERIKKLLEEGLTHKRIAAMFGVGTSNITAIHNGRSWR